MKTCSKCNENKPFSDFGMTVRRKPQSWCKKCTTEYTRNKRRSDPFLRERMNVIKNRHRNRNRSKVIDHLLNHPCVDCGETDIRVLDFDHIFQPEKYSDISKMLRDSLAWERIESEIGKCQILCANCHRKKTSDAANDCRSVAQRKRCERVSLS